MVKPEALVNIVPLDGQYIVRVSTEFTVNLENYNSKKFGGSYEGRFSSQHAPMDIGEHLGDQLYAMLTDEILSAQAVAPKDSYIQQINV